MKSSPTVKFPEAGSWERTGHRPIDGEDSESGDELLLCSGVDPSLAQMDDSSR